MQIKAEQSKKERILDAAENVFSAHGYEKATVDEIMALADVGKGTIYKYFGNKEKLFYQLVESKNKLFVEALKKASETGTSVKENLVNFFEAMIGFYRENAALWQIICFEMIGTQNGCLVTMKDGKAEVISRFDEEPSPELKEQILRYHLLLESEFGILKRLIEKGIESKELRPCDTEQSTLFIFFGVAMCVFHPNHITDRLSPAEGAKQVVDWYLYGAKR